MRNSSRLMVVPSRSRLAIDRSGISWAMGCITNQPSPYSAGIKTSVGTQRLRWFSQATQRGWKRDRDATPLAELKVVFVSM